MHGVDRVPPARVSGDARSARRAACPGSLQHPKQRVRIALPCGPERGAYRHHCGRIALVTVRADSQVTRSVRRRHATNSIEDLVDFAATDVVVDTFTVEVVTLLNIAS